MSTLQTMTESRRSCTGQFVEMQGDGVMGAAQTCRDEVEEGGTQPGQVPLWEGGVK